MSYQINVLDLSPVAYWRLGESSGAASSEVGSLDLTANGSPTYSATGLLVGDADTAIDFDGTDDYFSRSESGFRSGDSAGSVVMLVKPDTLAYHFFFSSSAGATGNDAIGFALRDNGAPYIYTNIGGTTNVVRANTGLLTAGQTAHLAFVSDGSAWSIYIDGVKITSLTVQGANTGDWFADVPNRTNINIGCLYQNGAPDILANGIIDEVAVFDAALSDAQIAQLYQSAQGNNALTLSAAIKVDAWELLQPDAAIRVDARPRLQPTAAIQVDAWELLQPAADIRVRTNLYTRAASVRVDTRHRLSPFAGIRVALVDRITSASAAIRVQSNLVQPSARIRVAPSEVISAPSAGIKVQLVPVATINRANRRWGVRVLVDGVDKSALVSGVVRIDQEEDASGLASFTLKPAAGTIDPLDYISQPVEIWFDDKDANGAVQYSALRFRGVISDPGFDPATARLNVQCTTDLQGAANALTRAQIDALVDGEYSPHIFGEGVQGFEYLQDRLETTTQALWHSPGGIRLTDWAAKAAADVELTDSDVYSGSLAYSPARRSALINSVQISFDYRFQRKRQRTLACRWHTTQKFCDLLMKGWTLCQRSMVEGAAKGTDWVVQGDITYTDLPPTGYYRCSPFSFGSSVSKLVGWGRLVGGLLLDDPDNAKLAWGAAWTASRRWAQTVTERHAITVSAPESVSANGEVGRRESYALECAQNVDDWVAAIGYNGTDGETGFAGTGGNAAHGNYTLGDIAKDATDDEATGRTAADQARRTAIAYGVARVKEAHRQNTASAETRFNPAIDLSKTVRINTTTLIAKGKVRRTVDTLDIATGRARTRVELAISQQGGTGIVTPSPVDPDTAPAPAADTDVPTSIYMETRIGGLKTSQPYSETWNGHTSNWVYDPTDTNPFGDDPRAPSTVVYPEQFTINYPEITGSHLDALELPANQTVDVAIDTDELTLQR